MIDAFYDVRFIFSNEEKTIKEKFENFIENEKKGNDYMLLSQKETEMFDFLIKNVSTCLNDLNIKKSEEISLSKKQELFLKTMKSLFLTFSTYSDEMKKRNNHELLESMISTFKQASLEDLVLKSQHDDLEIWLKEIIDCQNLFKQFLVSPEYTDGQSKGLLYKIKKDGKTCGYLYGTMHYLLDDKMQKAMDITKYVQKKLYKSSILGTEINLTKKTFGKSVEGRLRECAEKRGIVNFGIDTRERSKIFVNHETNLSDDEIEKKVYELVDAYCQGDENPIIAYVEEQQRQKDIEIEEKRNQTMAENIDAFLKAFETVGNKTDSEPKRGFFGVGFAHLVSTKNVPQAIPQLLTKMGYELSLASQKEHKVISLHDDNRNEELTIHDYIVKFLNIINPFAWK